MKPSSPVRGAIAVAIAALSFPALAQPQPPQPGAEEPLDRAPPDEPVEPPGVEADDPEQDAPPTLPDDPPEPAPIVTPEPRTAPTAVPGDTADAAHVEATDPRGDAVAAEGDGERTGDADGEDEDTWSWMRYVRPGVDAIAQYNFSIREVNDETDWFHEFEIPRIFGTITGNYEGAEGRLVVEAVRSASEGALIGVAGDSFVVRLREAYAGYTAWDMLTMRMGLVPTMTIRALQSSWATRAIDPVATQRVTYASPADLGATARVTLPIDLGWVGVGAYNGEGYNRRELNRGKNVELATQIHPLSVIEPVRPLSLFFSYVAGSTGTGLARQNRITGALMWTMERLGAGASVVYAQGFQDRGDIDGVLVEGWVRGEPYENVLLAGQVANWWRNLDAPEDDTILTVTAAGGYRIVKPLEAFLAFDAFVASDMAKAALPELDQYRIRAITRVSFDDGGFR